VGCLGHFLLRTAELFAVMFRKLMPRRNFVQDFLSIVLLPRPIADSVGGSHHPQHSMIHTKKLTSPAPFDEYTGGDNRPISWTARLRQQEVIFSFSWIFFRRRGAASCQHLGGSEQEAEPV